MMTPIQSLAARLLLLPLSAVLFGAGFAAFNPLLAGDLPDMNEYTLDYTSQTDPALQAGLEEIDARLRERYGMTPDEAAAGILDLMTLRLAMLHPDRIEYAASIPKIGILLAYFHENPDAATSLDTETRRALAMMTKISSNEMATRFSREIGLAEIQEIINHYGFYDAQRGGGLWVGKHYGRDSERIGDPVADVSHGATVRQVLRFYLMLQQEKLVSPEASRTMLEIFASPEIPHNDIKFVKALADRDVQLLRKWGTWRNWRHDSAIVKGSDRHYILVGLTRHPRGDDYLEGLAIAIDDLLKP